MLDVINILLVFEICEIPFNFCSPLSLAEILSGYVVFIILLLLWRPQQVCSTRRNSVTQFAVLLNLRRWQPAMPAQPACLPAWLPLRLV